MIIPRIPFQPLKDRLSRLSPRQIKSFLIGMGISLIVASACGLAVSRLHRQQERRRFEGVLITLASDTSLLSEPTLIANSSTIALVPAPTPSAEKDTAVTSSPTIVPSATPAVATSPPSATSPQATAPIADPAAQSAPDPSSPAPAAAATAAVSVLQTPPVPAPLDRWAAASQELADYLAQDPSITWDISLRDAKDGHEYLSAGTNQQMVAASTTKLLTASAFLSGIEDGRFSPDQQIGSFPADFQLDELVNQSDNDSWALLNETIGVSNLEGYAHKLGVGSYSASSNTVNPHEMSALVASLYQRKLLNPQHTDQLLGYMQNTEEERFLPPSVPSGFAVYHKVGLLDSFVHDLGVVTSGDQSYSIAMYSNGNGQQSYDERALQFSHIGSILFKGTSNPTP